jgi:hypothetical protein
VKEICGTQMLDEAGCSNGPDAGRDWTPEETGCWKRLDAGRDVETDVAIEDEW